MLKAKRSGETRGTIITFYSYKGGTGRTMALANAACTLARSLPPEEAVLVVDWDLEAPGLHRFFPPRRRRAHDLAQGLGLGPEPGLIDLFIDLEAALLPDEPQTEEDADRAAHAAVNGLDIERYIGDTEFAQVRMLRSGRDDDGDYSRRVNTFAWAALFRRAPGAYRLLAERLAERYRWVLIDSRTGVTDISGICTALLPDKLVVVFTPNRQSLSGVRELVSRALTYRRSYEDLRTLMVYPLPSRIEASLEQLRRDWRAGNAEAGIVGFQPVFEELFREAYKLETCDLTAYFDAVQIQQTADCAYGEVISVREGMGDRFSLASSYREFVQRLVTPAPPWTTDAAPPAAGADPAAAPAALEPGSAPSAEPIRVHVEPAEEAPATARRPVDASRPAASWSPPLKGGRRPSRPVQLFLSYASEDRPFVEFVAARLAKEGFDVFWDRERLLAGSEWRQQIEHALDSADVVLAFWSRRSVSSDFVSEEAAEGEKRGVLLPIVLDDVRVPLSFRRIQALSLVQPTSADFDQLVELCREIAERRPGYGITEPAAPGSPTGGLGDQKPGRPVAWARLSIAAALMLVAGVGWFAMSPQRSPPSAPNDIAAAARLTVVVPDVTTLSSDGAKAALERLGLVPRMVEAGKGGEQEYINGFVASQGLVSGTVVVQGTKVLLTVTPAKRP